MSGTPSFIRRWSQRKLEASASPPGGTGVAREPLAPPETLEFSADFSGYLDAEVPQEQRTAALRKLFMTDHYRAMDGLDVYVGDYSRPVELEPVLLGSLAHAQQVLASAQESLPADAVDSDKAGQA